MRKRQTAAYFGVLLFFISMGDPTGLLSVPILFVLKDQLHAGPEAVALFEAITLIPAYAAVLFGLLRDRVSPFGWGDRGHFLLAAPVAVGCYLWLAATPLNYLQLLGGVTAAMVAFQMLDSTASALVTVVGQRHGATGHLSAYSETIDTVVSIFSVLAGGWMVSHWSPKAIFLLAAILTLPVFLQSFWKPVSVFPRIELVKKPEERESLTEFVRKLGPQGRNLWPVAAILLLYNFSPGAGTPLFYYLIDKLKLSSEAFGMCRAVQYGGILAAAAIYGVTCRRLQMRQSLWLAFSLNILPAFLYLTVHGTAGAIAVSAINGLANGFATVVVFDLMMRACPPGLEGAGIALGHSVFGMAGAFGDVLGASVYARGGFLLCLALDAVATVLILPLLRRLPESVLKSTDKEAEPEPEAEPARMAVGA